MPDMPATNQGLESDRPVPGGPFPEPPGAGSTAPETPALKPPGSEPPLPAAAKRPRLKSLGMPLALIAVGLVLLIFGIVLYPRRTVDPAPATTQLFVDSNCPLFGIVYAVGSVQDHPGISQVTVRLVLQPSSLPSTKPCAENPAGLSVQPPDGIKVLDCSRCYGRSRVGLSFPPGRREADYAFFVRASSFGVASNGLTALAALPQVVYLGQGTPELFALYQVPSVSSYDWSDPPAKVTKSKSAITWDEPVASGETPGRVEVGTDQAAQASDTLKTFLAGGLIALAGAAILTAITEAVHTRDWEVIRALRSK